MLLLDFTVHNLQPGLQRQQPGQLDMGAPITLWSRSVQPQRLGLLSWKERMGDLGCQQPQTRTSGPIGTVLICFILSIYLPQLVQGSEVEKSGGGVSNVRGC